MNPVLSAGEADVIPLHHVPLVNIWGRDPYAVLQEVRLPQSGARRRGSVPSGPPPPNPNPSPCPEKQAGERPGQSRQPARGSEGEIKREAANSAGGRSDVGARRGGGRRATEHAHAGVGEREGRSRAIVGAPLDSAQGFEREREREKQKVSDCERGCPLVVHTSLG